LLGVATPGKLLGCALQKLVTDLIKIASLMRCCVGSFRYKFDDEKVELADSKRAVEDQYGESVLLIDHVRSWR
jgi:hypothetical protein